MESAIYRPKQRSSRNAASVCGYRAVHIIRLACVQVRWRRYAGELGISNSTGEAPPGYSEVSALPVSEQLLVLLLNQFQFILLLIPVVIAIGIAAFSIVDEKLTGSLEALLATPVRTWELLLGKMLAGAIPALLMTWVSAGFFLLVVSLLGWGNLSRLVLTPSWLLSIFLLTPAVAILSFMLGVIGSSRAKDSKGAQNIALIVVFPILALIGIQVTGIIWFSTLRTLVLALVIIGADIVALRAAVHLFQRESIAIQWR